MSSNDNSYGTSGTSGSQGSGSDGSSNSFTPYEINSRGTNSQENNYDNRTQPGGNAYHYSNKDGYYYYYSNSDGSKYHNSGDSTKYTAPNGNVYKKWCSPRTG